MDFLVMSQNKKFYDYPMHDHEFWEILLNIEGSGTAIIDKQKYDFCPGTIFCIRPGIRHSKKAEDGFIDGSILLSDFCFKSEKENVLVFQDDARHSFYSLFMLAYEYPLNQATDIYAERFLRSILDAMQNLLCHWKDSTYKNPEVLRVKKYWATTSAISIFLSMMSLAVLPIRQTIFGSFLKNSADALRSSILTS